MTKIFILAIALLSFNAWANTPIETVFKITDGSAGSGQMFVKTAVDGKVFSCFVDSGASYSVVKNSSTFATYPAVAKKEVVGISGSPVQMEQIKVNQIDFGGFEFNDRLFVREDAFMFDCLFGSNLELG